MNALVQPGKAVPVALEAEQGVLGTLLMNNAVLPVIGFLRAEHFSEPLHQAIFTAAAARIQRGEPANVITLAGDLPALSGLDMTPSGYLAHIVAQSWSTGAQIVGTARELVRLSARRDLMALGAEMGDAAALPGASAQDAVAMAETGLLRLSAELSAIDDSAREASPDDILAEIDERRRSGRHVRGVECGLSAIDARLGGFAPGQMVVIAGRPGMGKTALGLSLARRAARVGAGIGYLSLEMPKAELWYRLLSDEANQGDHLPVTYKSISRGQLEESGFDRVARANERLKKLPLVVRDRGSRLTDLPGHVRAMRNRLEQQGRALDIVIVDYLGLMQASDRYAGQRVNEVGEISATIKSLAMREGVCIIALHQLNRANESRDNKRPQLSDLRDSGNIEQDADVVMFVYRDAYYIERGLRSFADDAERLRALEDSKHRLEVIVAKQRQGEVGPCRLWVDMATNSVRDEAWH